MLSQKLSFYFLKKEGEEKLNILDKIGLILGRLTLKTRRELNNYIY